MGAGLFQKDRKRKSEPAQALTLLDNGDRILGIGKEESLLSESALSPAEQQVILSTVGQPLPPLLRTNPEALPLLAALTQLGVFSSGGDNPAQPKIIDDARNREIDEEAFVMRVMTRRALVDDGDYFDILGIARSATAYEIDRARDELLFEYSHERLTPRTIHLQEDLELLRLTINDAHLVLRDDVRRMRYRTALEASPGSARG